MLRQKFPNLSKFLHDATESQRGGFVSDEVNKMSFKMPVTTFGNHVGDNWLVIEKGLTGYLISIESKVGSNIKVKTNSKREFNEDLPFEDWNEILDEVLMVHIVKSEYREFSTGQVGKDFEKKLTGQGSGCMLFIVAGITISSLAYLLL